MDFQADETGAHFVDSSCRYASEPRIVGSVTEIDVICIHGDFPPESPDYVREESVFRYAHLGNGRYAFSLFGDDAGLPHEGYRCE